MLCPFCGDDAVSTQETMDLFCTGAPTTECSCAGCGAQWYDDTDGGLEEIQ